MAQKTTHHTTKDSDPSELGTNKVSPPIAQLHAWGIEDKIQAEPVVLPHGGDGTWSPKEAKATRVYKAGY